jgi:hypothetical protein
MHVRKAHDELSKLLASAAANLGTFVTASILLDGLDKDNNDIETGERVNGTVREKLRSARGRFEILCGIGEDGMEILDPQANVLRLPASSAHPANKGVVNTEVLLAMVNRGKILGNTRPFLTRASSLAGKRLASPRLAAFANSCSAVIIPPNYQKS